MIEGWSDFVSSPRARVLTLVLLTVQLGGCVLDLMSEQVVAGSVFCTAARGHGPLETAAFAVWLLLSFSWLLGLAALRLPRLRPLYWALILSILPALAAQSWLLSRGALFCDGP